MCIAHENVAKDVLSLELEVSKYFNEIKFLLACNLFQNPGQ